MKELSHERHESELSHNWVPLRELEPIGYYIGSKYSGNYHNRIELNLTALEHICRSADLPPIVLNSEKWEPPQPQSPVPISRGLAALKKVSLTGDQKELKKSDKIYSLSFSDERYDYGGSDTIPVGWEINIKDRKIMYDFDLSHPQSTKIEKENHFVKKLDKYLREAFVNISISEVLAVRVPGLSDRSGNVEARLLYQALAVAPGFFMLPYFPYPYLDQLLSVMAVQVVATGINVIEAMVSMRKAEQNYKAYDPYPMEDHKDATNLWRLNTFPDRSKKEPGKIDITRKLGLALIPGNYMMGEFFATLDSLLLQKTPLVRLA